MSGKKHFSTVGREEIPFDFERVEKSTGQTVTEDYVLVPASGLASRRFREAALSGTEMELLGKDDDPDSQRRVFKKMQGVAGLESRLVADCCYRVLRDGGRQGPLDQAFVEDVFPGDLIKWAFGEVKRISPWLDEKGDGDDLARLRRERSKLDERIGRLEAADPKG